MQKKALGQGAEILGENCELDKPTFGAKLGRRLSVGLVSRSEEVRIEDARPLRLILNHSSIRAPNWS